MKSENLLPAYKFLPFHCDTFLSESQLRLCILFIYLSTLIIQVSLNGERYKNIVGSYANIVHELSLVLTCNCIFMEKIEIGNCIAFSHFRIVV